MAKLSSFKRNFSQAYDTGEWVRVGDEYEDLEIQTRGFTDEYSDMRNAALRRTAVQKYRGDMTKITTAETRGITIDCIAAKSLLGVRNLVDDDGQPVALKDFVTMLRNPDYADLYNAALVACANVGRARAVDAEDDVKN